MSDSELIRFLQSLRADLDTLLASENAGYSRGIWTPTFGGFSVNPTVICRYVSVGKLCCAFVKMTAAGTSNAGSFDISAPFTATTVTGMIWSAPVIYSKNNGVAITAGAIAEIVSAGTVISVYRDVFHTLWTSAGDKYADFTLLYEIA